MDDNNVDSDICPTPSSYRQPPFPQAKAGNANNQSPSKRVGTLMTGRATPRPQIHASVPYHHGKLDL